MYRDFGNNGIFFRSIYNSFYQFDRKIGPGRIMYKYIGTFDFIFFYLEGQSVSTGEVGVVFAVCIFLIAEDGQKILVDHRASDNLVDCLKKKRIAERDFRDPATRKKFTYSCLLYTSPSPRD